MVTVTFRIASPLSEVSLPVVVVTEEVLQRCSVDFGPLTLPATFPLTPALTAAVVSREVTFCVDSLVSQVSPSVVVAGVEVLPRCTVEFSCLILS